VTREFARVLTQEIWIARIRLFAVPWAVLEVGLLADDYPRGYEFWAWVTTAILAVGAVALLWLARSPLDARKRPWLGAGALAFDTGIIYAYFFLYAFEPVLPARTLIFLAVIEAAVRYGVRGGVIFPLATAPLLVLIELSRADHFGSPAFEVRHVTLPLGVQLIMGLIVGGLVRQLGRETQVAETRAAEAEDLRDQIGRRADVLEAVNRCGRALASSLDQRAAFDRFLREAESTLAFDRLAIILAEGDRAEVAASSGGAADTVFPAGSSVRLEGTLAADVITQGRTIVREDMAADPVYSEEAALIAAGFRSRIGAPLSLGGRTIGMLGVSRGGVSAFSQDDIDLIALLARQVATTVENIRAFQAERLAADELRRLSALRADFVSLVSHELRTPMASVIGSASTLRARWRSLTAAQRESFLALIEEETSRLALLIGDVLDTSRLEAGTFSYSFSDLDVAELVREVVSVVDLGQEEVDVRADVADPLPRVRGDRERIRQLLLNLVANAVKYTVSGDEIEIRASADNGTVSVSVRDNGPGISPEDQRVIFDKFARAPTGHSKPGAGLGLYIARSIAEAHGGSLDVASAAGAGATFTLRLPAAR
jgi:signal transduction histidine kinase